MFNAALSTVTGGAGFGYANKLKGEPGYERMVKAGYRPEGDAAREIRQHAHLRQTDRRL